MQKRHNPESFARLYLPVTWPSICSSIIPYNRPMRQSDLLHIWTGQGNCKLLKDYENRERYAHALCDCGRRFACELKMGRLETLAALSAGDDVFCDRQSSVSFFVRKPLVMGIKARI